MLGFIQKNESSNLSTLRSRFILSDSNFYLKSVVASEFNSLALTISCPVCPIFFLLLVWWWWGLLILVPSCFTYVSPMLLLSTTFFLSSTDLGCPSHPAINSPFICFSSKCCLHVMPSEWIIHCVP